MTSIVHARKYSPEMLRDLRNNISIDHLIADILGLPAKVSEGRLRFQCPACSEFLTATNPKTNLARCFHCKINYNPIDMVMRVRRSDFVSAVEYLRGIRP